MYLFFLRLFWLRFTHLAACKRTARTRTAFSLGSSDTGHGTGCTSTRDLRPSFPRPKTCSPAAWAWGFWFPASWVCSTRSPAAVCRTRKGTKTCYASGRDIRTKSAKTPGERTRDVRRTKAWCRQYNTYKHAGVRILITVYAELMSDTWMKMSPSPGMADMTPLPGTRDVLPSVQYLKKKRLSFWRLRNGRRGARFVSYLNIVSLIQPTCNCCKTKLRCCKKNMNPTPSRRALIRSSRHGPRCCWRRSTLIHCAATLHTSSTPPAVCLRAPRARR